MATPATQPTNQIDPQQKAAILMAVAQLDMLVQAFATAPERVLKSAKEFKASLEEWANG